MSILGPTTARFVLNKAGLNELANSQKSGQAMEKLAEQLLPRVESNGGRFTRGYKVKPIKVEGTMGARLGTDDPFAHWDEWGNRYRRPRSPLRRALASAGLLSRTKQSGKP